MRSRPEVGNEFYRAHFPRIEMTNGFYVLENVGDARNYSDRGNAGD